MDIAQPTSELRTPEQVAESLGRDDKGKLHLSPVTIRRLVREGVVAATRLPRGKVALTRAQVDSMLATLEQPAGQPAAAEAETAAASAFAPSARSQARRTPAIA